VKFNAKPEVVKAIWEEFKVFPEIQSPKRTKTRNHREARKRMRQARRRNR
jgi:hypothetical protein